ENGLTYAGIGLYSWALFAGERPGRRPLRPLLDRAIASGALGGEYYAGRWEDVGTPARLEALDAQAAGE
ncbi:MAG: nucleotidyltransferase family protein, partial [Halioglobus sp.]|nr:nucleotidyltransferase family protein [Halioglobus sp.]